MAHEKLGLTSNGLHGWLVAANKAKLGNIHNTLTSEAKWKDLAYATSAISIAWAVR